MDMKPRAYRSCMGRTLSGSRTLIRTDDGTKIEDYKTDPELSTGALCGRDGGVYTLAHEVLSILGMVGRGVDGPEADRYCTLDQAIGRLELECGAIDEVRDSLVAPGDGLQHV